MACSVLVESPENPHPRSTELLNELLMILPGAALLAAGMDVPDDSIVVKIHQDIGPQFLVFSSRSTQFVFKIIEYRSRAMLGITTSIKNDPHQLVLSHFATDLGLRVADLFMSLFPINLESTQVVNLAVHRDFIFFRMYRFCVTEKGPVFEKIGPHLTLRLWRIVETDGDKKTVHSYQKYVKNANLL